MAEGRRRRILRAMDIFELSAVDKPAQEGARYLLAKRDKPMTAPKMCPDCKKPMDECECDDKKNESDPSLYLCAKCGKKGDKPGECDCGGEMKPKPKKPGLTDPDTGKGKSAEDKSKEGDMTDAEKLAKAEKDLADEKAKNEVLAKVAVMTDAEKAHYDALKELDADGAKKFLDMGKDERAAEIKKAEGADPVIYTDSEGHEYRKSEARSASLAKRADDMAKENAELKKKDEERALEKRAADFPNLKGELVAKVALLRAVDGIADEATRTQVTEMLKANDAGLGEAMKTLGTKAGPQPTEPEAKLNKMAEEKAEADKITFAKAYDIVAQTPEGKKLYEEVLASKGK